jgi:hypothetical protein
MPSAHAQQCERTITANVVLIENPTVFNRLGAQNPNWFTFALRRDAVYWDRLTPDDPDNGKSVDEAIAAKGLNNVLGKIELRPDKRPRPLVLRSAEGDCLTVDFQSLLDPIPNNQNPIQGNLDNNDQVAGRCAGVNTTGTELLMVSNKTGDPIGNDASMVGQNHAGEDIASNCGIGDRKGGMVGPGGRIKYHLYTPHEGAYIINSYGALLGSEASSGNIALGMFGALNVQPKGAKFYRSQVTEEEMRLATVGTVPSACVDASGAPLDPSTTTYGIDCDMGGQPIIDYEATYPDDEPWKSEGKANLPVLNMLTASNELVHSDINAIIVGTGENGTFDPSTYPLESVGRNNPQYPNRLEPFREFTSQFHDEQTNSQVYPRWYNDPVLGFTLAGVKDAFMINYGSGGIGSEIISNRTKSSS